MDDLPKQLGQYEVIRRLALGGMGEVLLARTVNAEEVVLKRILPSLSSNERFEALFREEVRITQKLKHPNIIQVLDVGRSNSELFLVLERIRGISLAATIEELELRSERLPMQVVAYIGAEVAKALDHAHHLTDEAGNEIAVVHQDVSPANILLSREGAVKLTDFGLARAQREVGPQVQQATGGRGRSAYLAPETIEEGIVSSCSDLWSLGAVLYKALTAESAFGSGDEAETIRRILTDSPNPPSMLNPSVPDELDDLVCQMFQRRPEKRPDRGAEVARRLVSIFDSSFPHPKTLLGREITRLRNGETSSDVEAKTPVYANPEQNKILVIDESRTFRSILRTTLSDQFAVVEAGSAEEAKELLGAGTPPSAVVCQRTLPGISGVDMCRYIRTQKRLAEIPFILLTTELSPELEEQAASAGVRAVLPREVDLLRLREKIAFLIK